VAVLATAILAIGVFNVVIVREILMPIAERMLG
jgi:hypothetical protein